MAWIKYFLLFVRFRTPFIAMLKDRTWYKIKPENLFPDYFGHPVYAIKLFLKELYDALIL